MEPKSILSSISLAPILQTALCSSDGVSDVPAMSDVRLLANGLPVITTSNGRSYSYNPSLKTWIKIADGWLNASEIETQAEAFIPSSSRPSGPLRNAQNLAKTIAMVSTENSDTMNLIKRLIGMDKKALAVMSASYIEVATPVNVSSNKLPVPRL